jgi:ribonuclease D
MSEPDILITTAPALRELSDHLRAAGRFAFDTEFVSEDTYEPVLGLVQVATADRVLAVDPIAIGNLDPLWDVLHDPAVEVVMHAAGEDLRICRLRSGRLPARVVDVQLAAGLVGYTYPISLNNLVRQELGVTLAGGETRTDWRRRPLSPAQLRYALDDVKHLLPLADRLHGRMAEWGRSHWAEAEYGDLLASVESRHADEDRWRRLPGLGHLSRRGLEVARRLDAWRRAEARRNDRPVRQVLRDDILVSIAKRQPDSRKDLEALRDIQRSPVMSRAREVLDIVAEARQVPDDQLPAHNERHEEGPGLSMVVSLLAATLNQCAAAHRVATPLVGTSADLKDLVRWHNEGGNPDRRPALLEGWRGALCGRTLTDVLGGRRALRIVDPAAEVPVALDEIDGRP